MVAALQAAHLQDKLINTNPTGVVSLVIDLGLYLGVVLASPYVLYQIWLFVAPGLYKHERKAMAGFIVPSRTLISGGNRLLVLRDSAVFAAIFGQLSERVPLTPLISIDEYFDLVLIVLLGVGVVFELPMVILMLSLFGIVTPEFLWKNFRYAHSDHHHRGGDHHADAGCDDDARVHGADDLAIYHWHRGFVGWCCGENAAKSWRARGRIEMKPTW